MLYDIGMNLVDFKEQNHVKFATQCGVFQGCSSIIRQIIENFHAK